jgi:hypothetical protein
MYYYPTILWGRLAGAPSGSGGLPIRLPAATTMPENRSGSLRLAAMRGTVENPAEVGRTPWSAAGPLAGLLGSHETDVAGRRASIADARTRARPTSAGIVLAEENAAGFQPDALKLER